jgi:peptidoglycan/LPS O-acetylase OafA/YrhL
MTRIVPPHRLALALTLAAAAVLATPAAAQTIKAVMHSDLKVLDGFFNFFFGHAGARNRELFRI